MGPLETESDVHFYAMVLSPEVEYTSPTWEAYKPLRIIRNGPATIVFWRDGTKTVVKKCNKVVRISGKNFYDLDDNYNAFTAALAKKIFGSNSRVKKIVEETETVTKRK